MAYKAQILNPAAGGTGVANNDASTLTISGAFASTFTMTNTTSVTFPTSGTLATTSQLPTLPLSASNGGTGANNAATSGKVLIGNGTQFVPTTASYPTTAGAAGNVLTSDGTNFNSSTPTPVYQVVSGTLTNAQVKALHGTPIQLIAAPGAGKAIIVAQAIGKLAYGGTNVFTAGASQTIQAYYGTTISIANLLNNAGVIASASQLSVQGGQYNASAYASIANAAVNAYNPIATEITGNAANDNTVPYMLIYYIVTI